LSPAANGPHVAPWLATGRGCWTARRRASRS